MQIKNNPGGLAEEKKFTEKDADPQQLKMGINVEMEHTNDRKKAAAIALDHLAEIPDYYTRLQRMEDQAEKEEGAQKSEQGKGKVEQALVDFLQDNPNPDDEQMHELAGKLGVEVDDLEEQVYAMAARSLTKADKAGTLSADSRGENRRGGGGIAPIYTGPDSGTKIGGPQRESSQIFQGLQALADYSEKSRQGLGSPIERMAQQFQEDSRKISKAGEESAKTAIGRGPKLSRPDGSGSGKTSTGTYQHYYTQDSLAAGTGISFVPKGDTKMAATDENLEKGGPYIGPKGGKWADPEHKIPYQGDKYVEGIDHTRKLEAKIPGQKEISTMVSATAQAVKDAGGPDKLATAIEADYKGRWSKKVVSMWRGAQNLQTGDAPATAQTDIPKALAAQAMKEHKGFDQAAEAVGRLAEKSMTSGLEALEDYTMHKADDGKPGESLEETSTSELKATYQDLESRMKAEPDDKGIKARHEAILAELKKRGAYKTEAQAHMDKCSTPGAKIRSGGAGRGMAVGQGEGPLRRSLGAGLEALEDYLEKAGPYIGPKGGKWADPEHKIPWKEDTEKQWPTAQHAFNELNFQVSQNRKKDPKKAAEAAKKLLAMVQTEKYSHYRSYIPEIKKVIAAGEGTGRDAQKSLTGLDGIEDYLAKSLPTTQAGADGGKLDGAGKQAGGPPSKAADLSATKEIKAKQKLSEDDEDEEKQMRPHKKPIEKIRKSAEGDLIIEGARSPYQMDLAHGITDAQIAARLEKSEDADYYLGGSPEDVAAAPTIHQGVLCKSCGHRHTAALTACPNCGNGSTRLQVLAGQVTEQVQLVDSRTPPQGLTLRKSEPDLIIK